MSPQVRRELERIRQRYFFEKANSYEAIWVLREAMSLAKTHEGLLDAMELAQTAEIRNLMTDGGWRACQRHLAHWAETFEVYPGERYCFDSLLTDPDIDPEAPFSL